MESMGSCRGFGQQDGLRSWSALGFLHHLVHRSIDTAKPLSVVSKLPEAGVYEFDRYGCALLRQALDEASDRR